MSPENSSVKPYLSSSPRESIETTSTEAWLALRTKDITSTESAALFGLSPYLTPFELWHRKRNGNVVTVEQSERMKWGTRLQDSIAAGIAEDQKWSVQKRTQYERLPKQRLGASYDFTIMSEQDGQGLLEIKNVDPLVMRDGWIVEEGEVEAPPHIEMQVQHQLLVSGLPYAYIGALVGGNRTVLIRREPKQSILDSIIEKTEEFWRSVDAGQEPKPDFQKDAEFITRLYQNVRPGSVIDLKSDAEFAGLGDQYGEYGSEIKRLEGLRASIKAQILMKIGDVEKAIGEGFSVSAGPIASTVVPAYERAAYRGFRLNFKKAKES